MRRVIEFTDIKLLTSGSVCDRCGAIEDVPAIDRPAPPSEAFVSIKVQYEQRGEVLRGDFCPACDRELQTQAGGWRPHLRSVTRYLEDREYWVFRFQIQDARTGERRWIESLLPDDEMM